MEPFSQARIDTIARGFSTLPSEDSLLGLNPGWTREDAMVKRFNAFRVDPEAVYALFRVLPRLEDTAELTNPGCW